MIKGTAVLRTSMVALVMASGTAAWSQTTRRTHSEPAAPAAPARTQAQIDARVDALLARMTVEEKAGQLTQLFQFGAPQVEQQVASGRLGSVLFVTDPVKVNQLQRVAIEKTRLKIPLLFGFDVIHGLRTAFPVPIGMAASWDPDLVERAQAVAAREARAVGVHWTFAPMVDVARDARWGRVIEGAGEDPYLGSAMAAAQVRGFQGSVLGAADRVLAGPKHFVGYGAALGGRDNDEVDLSDQQLWNIYLPPFRAAIDAGALNVMSAYMAVNGIPAAGNKPLLTDLLRGKLGFKGFVVSDANAVKSLVTHGLAIDDADAATRAIDAGVDMEMAIAGPAYNKLPAAVAAGRVSMADLDRAVRRVLEIKFRMGLFENPYVDESRAEAVLNDPTSRTAARVAAERAAVLLRNEGGMLPLDPRKLKSVAVIGPLADSAADALGSWIFGQNKPHMSSVLSGLRARLGDATRITYAPGVAMAKRSVPSPFGAIGPRSTAAAVPDAATGMREAVAAAQGADVAIMVLGESQEMSGEAASRASFALPGEQQALLDAVVATGKPVVVVLMSGRPLDLAGTKANAILDIWYPGSEAGAATSNLLFGDAVPAGRLPFTWPINAAHSPDIYSHLPSHSPENAHKRYWDQPGPPSYVFGYGLSYTTFSYTNLKVAQVSVAPGQPIDVTVDVSNTGHRTGDEVAQLYIHQRSGTASRPVRELKGFQRVTLKPGETRRLRFRLRPQDLRYWNSAAKGWVADASIFDVAVGGSSDAKFEQSFTVATQ